MKLYSLYRHEISFLVRNMEKMNEDTNSSSGGGNDGEESLYEVKWSQELGRYLVATRNIDAREIIIREDPLISCPKQILNIPVCLGCSGVMQEDSTNRCTKCRWPVCNEDCEKLAPHSLNECKVFKKNRVTYPPPNGWPFLCRSVLILRCLLLKTLKPAQWEQLMKMSDNADIRKGKPNCINMDKKILENFQKFFSNDEWSENRSLEKEIIRINGIIDTNAHAYPLRVNRNSTPNASWSPDRATSDLTLTIRANVPIPKGSMISVAYDEGQLLVSTLKRLIPNEINGMFVCKCERCLSRTELGTFVGALKCPDCEQGYLLPIDPVDSFSSWKCDNGRNKNTFEEGEENDLQQEPCCNLVLDDESIVEIIEDAESTCGYTKMNLASVPSRLEESTESDNSQEEDEMVELLKEFVKEYSGNILHPNHYILQEVNVRILKKEYENGLAQLSDTDLIFFLERCEQLLKVADVLTPGFCEYQAFLQFHFCQGLLNLERRKETNKIESMKANPMKAKCDGSGHPLTDDDTTKASHSQLQDRKCSHNDEFNEKHEGDDVSKSQSKQDHDHIDNCNQIQKQIVAIDCNDIENNNTNENHIISSRRSNEEIMTTELPVNCNYKSTHNNLRRIKKMLTFLLEFFKEISTSHKLLEPITDTLEETEMRLGQLEK